MTKDVIHDARFMIAMADILAGHKIARITATANESSL